MLDNIPNSCGLKPMFTCSAMETVSRCTATGACVWDASRDCSRGGSDTEYRGRVEEHDGCVLEDVALYKALTKGSCDADVPALLQGIMTDKACKAAMDSAACGDVTIPAKETQPACEKLKADGGAGNPDSFGKTQDPNGGAKTASGAMQSTSTLLAAVAIAVCGLVWL